MPPPLLKQANAAALLKASSLEAQAVAAKGDADVARQEALRVRDEAAVKGAQLTSTAAAAAAAAASARAEADAAKGDAETARLGVERAVVESERLSAVLSQAEIQVRGFVFPRANYLFLHSWGCVSSDFKYRTCLLERQVDERSKRRKLMRMTVY